MIIAIDGPAASGKGTLAKRIALYFGYPCLDTGLLYRAVARDCANAGHDLEDEAAAANAAGRLNPATLADPGLRLPGAGDKASIVAKFSRVRAALLEFQRDFAHLPPGAVLDGRDIGTVICPNADVKLFVTASLEERTRRRLAELRARGEQISFEELQAQIAERDERDTNRTESPLRQAADAHVLDTTNLSVEAAAQAAYAIVDSVIASRS